MQKIFGMICTFFHSLFAVNKAASKKPTGTHKRAPVKNPIIKSPLSCKLPSVKITALAGTASCILLVTFALFVHGISFFRENYLQSWQKAAFLLP